MVSKANSSEKSMFEMWRVALSNAEKQGLIAEKMAGYGYDGPVMAEGNAVYKKTRGIYDLNKTEDDETSFAREDFNTKKTSLFTLYAEHRQLGRIVFRNNAVLLEQLGLNGTLSKVYIEKMENIKKFYTLSQENPEIQQKLLRLKLDAEKIAAGKTLVTEVEEARANYLREIGESEDATKHKDDALAEMASWMSDFYAVARIALKDHPQLLEALGKGVKS